MASDRQARAQSGPVRFWGLMLQVRVRTSLNMTGRRTRKTRTLSTTERRTSRRTSRTLSTMASEFGTSVGCGVNICNCCERTGVGLGYGTIGSVILISFVSPEIVISPQIWCGLDSTVQNGRPPLSSSTRGIRPSKGQFARME